MNFFDGNTQAGESVNPRIAEIMLSTGNINRKYVVRDIVFATDKQKVDLFATDTNPNEIFQKVSLTMKEHAYNYGANAVINCHFEQQVVHDSSETYLEIFAYGTVVQFSQTNIG